MTEEVFLNPNDKGTGVALSNNNLTATFGGTVTTNTVRANQGRENGKWYWETTVNDRGVGANYPSALLNGGAYSGAYNSGFGFYTNDSNIGSLFSMGTVTASGFPPVLTGDTIGIAIDLDASPRTAIFIIDNQEVTRTEITLSGEVFPILSSGTNGRGVSTINFGATPFKYPIPEGYKPYQPPFDKTLILSNNEAYTHDGTEWENIGTPPTDIEERKAFYETHGMERITADQAKQLKTTLPNGKGKISVMKL